MPKPAESVARSRQGRAGGTGALCRQPPVMTGENPLLIASIQPCTTGLAADAVSSPAFAGAAGSVTFRPPRFSDDGICAALAGSCSAGAGTDTGVRGVSSGDGRAAAFVSRATESSATGARRSFDDGGRPAFAEAAADRTEPAAGARRSSVDGGRTEPAAGALAGSASRLAPSVTGGLAAAVSARTGTAAVFRTASRPDRAARRRRRTSASISVSERATATTVAAPSRWRRNISSSSGMAKGSGASRSVGSRGA